MPAIKFFKTLSTCQKVMLATLTLVILRLLYIGMGPLDLGPDEAQYWDWSRTPQLSYYSKPALVSWIHMFFANTFGMLGVSGEILVRLPAVLIHGISALFVYNLAKDYKGKTAGLWAFAMYQVLPIFAAGGLLMVPDVVTGIFWLIALGMLSQMDWHWTDKGYKPFIILGLVIGLAGLSKYSAGIFYPLLFLFLLTSEHRRQWLFHPHIYIAGLTSLIVMLPVWVWNIQNGGVGLKHLAGQASGESGTKWLETMPEFLGGQAGIWGGVLFILLLCAWCGARRMKDEKAQLYFWMSFPIFALFFVLSFTSKVQANWPVLACLGGVILLAGFIAERGKVIRKLAIIGLVMGAFVTAMLHDTSLMRVTFKAVGAESAIPKKDPMVTLKGWETTAQLIDVLKSRIAGDPVVMVRSYGDAAVLSFYLKGQPRVVYANPGLNRMNQYDLWAWPEEQMKNNLTMFVVDANRVPPKITALYASCAFMQRLVVTDADNIHLRNRNVFLCGGYKGGRPEMATTY
jgi:4-amino-4-deoxy-L-arabinose transferase-like glycosyltransferase